MLFCLEHTLLQLLEGCISSRGGGLLQLEQVSNFAERGVHFDLERRGSNSAGVGAHLIRRTLTSKCSVGVRAYFKRKISRDVIIIIISPISCHKYNVGLWPNISHDMHMTYLYQRSVQS